MIYQWLLVAILAYLFFSFSSLGDKLVLSGKPRAKSYTFYMGLLGLVVVLVIPFINFTLPGLNIMIWVFLNAAVRVLAIYSMFIAVEKFEVSKVVPTIGAIQPIFIFVLSYFFWDSQLISGFNFLAFIFLLTGSILISFEPNRKINWWYFGITIFSSLMFSLDYIFSKKVFLTQPFLQGVVWTGLCVFLFVLLFLFKKSTRKEIFAKNIITDKRTQIVFLGTQACGGLGNFLQSFAIYLTPVAFLPIINSLRGIQYVFLFLITLFISFLFPKVLKENISFLIIAKKSFSIVLIAIGLAILVIG